MKQNGQFLLFNKEEFRQWLYNNKFNRIIKLIQNHHTWSPSYINFNGSNHFSLLQGMKDFHVNSARFSDIAQHLTTFPDGTIAICRSFEKDPAGIIGANSNALCIENIGDFDVGKDIMTQEHKTTIVFLNYILCERFNLAISTNSIVYHNWYDLNSGARLSDKQIGSRKTCPGTNYFGGNSIEACLKYFLPLVKELQQPVITTSAPSLEIPTFKNINALKKVIASSLNVRDFPSAGNIIGILNNGEVITANGVNNDESIFRINFTGKYGYISAQYTVATLPQWMIDGEKFLFDKGFTTQRHNPNELIRFDMFGYMMNNFLSKKANIDPIQYLKDNNFIKGKHTVDEIITWEVFAYMMINRTKETLIKIPIDFLLNKGFITSIKSPTDKLDMACLGSALKNYLSQNKSI